MAVTSLGQVSGSDIRLLRIFKTVVEGNGFAAAEVALNISRAAVSVSISDLEKRLGLRLCQRGRSGFALTDEGREVYQASLQMLASMETFRSQVYGLHHELRGELSIGITDNLVTFPGMLITNALRDLKRKAAEVRVHIRMTPPQEIELGVLDGALHVGAIPTLRTLHGLDYLRLYDERLQLYCGADHSLFHVPDDQLTETLIARQDAVTPVYAPSHEIEELHQQLNSTATATEREGVAFLILTGQYIGYLPTHFAEQWLATGRMRALASERYFYHTPFSLITRKSARANRVLDTFLTALQKEIDAYV